MDHKIDEFFATREIENGMFTGDYAIFARLTEPFFKMPMTKNKRPISYVKIDETFSTEKEAKDVARLYNRFLKFKGLCDNIDKSIHKSLTTNDMFHRIEFKDYPFIKNDGFIRVRNDDEN